MDKLIEWLDRVTDTMWGFVLTAVVAALASVALVVSIFWFFVVN